LVVSKRKIHAVAVREVRSMLTHHACSRNTRESIGEL
jgi:hypothetical protein